MEARPVATDRGSALVDRWPGLVVRERQQGHAMGGFAVNAPSPTRRRGEKSA